ncbi:glycosyltransferase [Panacibacter sp. DH6]|uniref:Glycosyltransferase n=1 Tax=Panacibacter microcysteis TaxID=2793269 RepID=A0A931E5F5_9BACT|nr:glycosyltransferase family 4 protein [Panacibacter microcysteis]MBG9375484.1 glycosyltransferase [Panacibacter microcysteis]
MKVLIVTDALPFPALNGKQLPIAGLFECISKTHITHLLVLAEAGIEIKDHTALPKSIIYKGSVPVKKINSKKKLISSALTFKHSISLYKYDKSSLGNVIGSEHYDFIWVSPAHYYSFISFCNNNNLRFFKKVAIGLNDCKTFQFRDSINELMYSRIFKLRYVTEWLRSFPLEREERNFLALADIVHVQTLNEAEKVRKVVRNRLKPLIVAAPNGIKEELFACSYNGVNSNVILFMTHLHGHRLKESEWFITKVWPVIKKKLPEAKLSLVGTPPKTKIDYIDTDSSILINGYADDIHELYNTVRLAVVPTFHGTGLINRILDAITAGVPVVSTPQAIATFPGLISGKEILSASGAKQFADAVIKLYTDINFRCKMAADGRLYAKTQNTWPQSALVVQEAMESLV